MLTLYYKVLHLKPNGAHGVSPLLRPCWIPPIPAAFMHAHRLAVCTSQYCTGHQHEQVIDYSNAFSCVNVILNGNHQAVFAQSVFKRTLGEVPPSRFTIHEIVKKFETKNEIVNVQF